ncbi:MAG: phosphate acyltransferase PlsX, partial [Alphaproteobacteria bacterium]
LMNRICIALDAMGGDHSPRCVLGGADLALQDDTNLYFHIFGNKEQILPLWQSTQRLRHFSEIHHTDEVITPELKPAQALLGFKKSSMRLAIACVAAGEAQAVISGGNTGAYVALSKVLLKMITNIDRPVLPALMPSIKGTTVLLDVGANLNCDAENLVQFAIMGECFARILLQKESPSIGLLNIGSEESKGHPALHEAAQMLKKMPNLNFYGFIEGSDITLGTVDVVVTDGFSGNLVLKAIEGSAHFFAQLLRDALGSSLRGRLGYKMAAPAFTKIKEQIDPRHHNGTLFLGLKGLAVKSHGGTDAVGFANAIQVAASMVQKNLVSSIEERQIAREAIPQ